MIVMMMMKNQHLRILHPRIIHQLTAQFHHWPHSCIIHWDRNLSFVCLFFFLQCWNLSSWQILPFSRSCCASWQINIRVSFVSSSFLFQTLFSFSWLYSFLYSYVSLYCSLLVFVVVVLVRWKTKKAEDTRTYSLSLSLCLFSSLVFFSRWIKRKVYRTEAIFRFSFIYFIFDFVRNEFF